MIVDYLVIVGRSLLQRKLRSWLTIISIVIGIASIVSLITISQSLEASLTEQFEVFGSDKLIITSASIGGQFNLFTGLTTKDVDAVMRVSDIEFVLPYLTKSTIAEYKNERRKIDFLIGTPAEQTEVLFEEFGLTPKEGRFFTTDSFQIVIGPLAATDLFDDALRLRSRVELEGKKFEVVGILESIGNPQDDSQVYMPLGTMRDLFDDKETVSFIQAKVKEGRDISGAAVKVQRELARHRDEEEFDVLTAEQLLSQLGAVLGIIQAVLVSIAAISLLVGAVGISNVMYTAITERTRTIGIMKAVGATNAAIVLMFVLEAGILGMLGGILGTLLGFAIAWLVGVAAAGAGWEIFRISINPALGLIGVAFAVAVGMISGALPARQAASLKPVDALRFGK